MTPPPGPGRRVPNSSSHTSFMRMQLCVEHNGDHAGLALYPKLSHAWDCADPVPTCRETFICSLRIEQAVRECDL